MSYNADLERLLTLDRRTIDRVCGDTDAHYIDQVIAACLDEAWELDEQATNADELGSGIADAESIAAYSRQEAAAWRATVIVLRQLAASRRDGARQEGAA